MKVISHGVYFDKSSRGVAERRHNRYRAEVRVDGRRLRRRFDKYNTALRWIESWQAQDEERKIKMNRKELSAYAKEFCSKNRRASEKADYCKLKFVDGKIIATNKKIAIAITDPQLPAKPQAPLSPADEALVGKVTALFARFEEMLQSRTISQFPINYNQLRSAASAAIEDAESHFTSARDVTKFSYVIMPTPARHVIRARYAALIADLAIRHAGVSHLSPPLLAFTYRDREDSPLFFKCKDVTMAVMPIAYPKNQDDKRAGSIADARTGALKQSFSVINPVSLHKLRFPGKIDYIKV